MQMMLYNSIDVIGVPPRH